MITPLELLAPARDVESGRAAVDHGADALYIGPDKFGARVAASNSVRDIAQLCQYAHLFGVKVYATVNTILYDNELQEVRQLTRRLSQAGVDALLVQDMAMLRICQEEGRQGWRSIALHASTQTDNRTAGKVRWLRDLGFSRVVLSRELTLREIADIHRQVPDIEIEVFVHGALCVSYSGQCYASQYCFGRSANRGECAQLCRMRYDLIDNEGKTIEPGRHLLSLKDLCLIDHLQSLIDAGATSFKIEGRLKDINYVKNVTAAYSQRLDEIIARYPDKYCRASKGKCQYTFKPDVNKTFNRGYTTYFLNGRRSDISSPDTPKAMGEYVGEVKEIRAFSIVVSGTSTFANGDGLCFLNDAHELTGFRVNRVEANRLYPYRIPEGIRKGMPLYRNNDNAFESILRHPSATRKIGISMAIRATANGFALQATCGDSRVSAEIEAEHQRARTPQQENIEKQLTKLGSTVYKCEKLDIPVDFDYFIPSSKLASLRREVIDRLERKEAEHIERHQKGRAGVGETRAELPDNYHKRYPYLYNVSNHISRDFYTSMGIENVGAFELERPPHKGLLMQCRHCLKYSMGYCRQKNSGREAPWQEPLRLRLSSGREFYLEFDCKNCQMNVKYDEDY